MGLFDDFDIDMDDVKAAGGFDFEDGFYEWEISEALRQNGTKKHPDNTYFIIKYNLDEAGTFWEWFTIAVDRDPHHKDAKRSLGYLKSRLADLGIPASQMNELEPEELEGIAGTFKLVTTKNAKGEFQNIRNFKVTGAAEDEAEDEPEESDADIKKRVAAKRAAREEPAKKAPAKRAPARRKVSDDDEDENPFG